MAIRWDFNRAAKALVAARQKSKDITVPHHSKHPSLLVELNHWVVGQHPFANVKNGVKDKDVVYLVHPPIIMPSSTNHHHSTAAEEEIIEEEFDNDMPGDDLETHSEPILCPKHCNYTEWTFSIVFHDVWRVPTLYFTCGHPDGSPLCRKEVLHILLNHASLQQSNIGEWSEHDLWEFVSQEEHPMTGKSSYFLHPCRTEERMELMLLQSKEQVEQVNSYPLLS